MTDNASFFIDSPELDNLVLDFDSSRNSISNLILNSQPRFTLGIYGDWGMGKTTLMKNIEQILKKHACNCIDFNAWRYALEPRHATYPLMLNIINNLLALEEVKKNTDDDTLTKIKNKAIRVASGLSLNISGGIPGLGSVGANLDFAKALEKTRDSDYDELEESKPVLQKGIDVIQELLNYVTGPSINKELKLVIFIDDLDRCTPEKVVEVFESIKVFFDLDKIVFVLGLSSDIVTAAINKKYEDFHGLFSGEEYLKKIIQVPFSLPPWTSSDVVDFLVNLIRKNKDNPYSEFFKENLHLIVDVTLYNPREIKRLLNNFILSYEIHKENKKINMTNLFVMIALAHRFRKFYEDIITAPSLLKKIYDEFSTLEDSASKENLKNPGTFMVNLTTEISRHQLLKKYSDLIAIIQIIRLGDAPLLTMERDEWIEYRRATVVAPAMEYPEEEKKPQSEGIRVVPPRLLPNRPARKISIDMKGGISGMGQIQDELALTTEVEVGSERILRFQYFTAGKQCSDMRLHIFIDGENIGETEWLGYDGRSPSLPMNTELFTIDNVPKGTHKLTLQPEGREGGCNEGYIQQWEGSLLLP